MDLLNMFWFGITPTTNPSEEPIELNEWCGTIDETEIDIIEEDISDTPSDLED